MNLSLQSQLEKALQERCKPVADSWYEAIARTSYVSLDAAEVRGRLAGLAEQAARLLVTESVDQDQAQEIGVALARLHYLQPEALGRTIGILASRFSDGLPAEQAVALQPGLAVLLKEVATGFGRQMRETVLAEQEIIRGALVSALQATEHVLRAARDELEIRVQERTLELAQVNEELRIEITERKRMEEALRESEKTARALLNAPADLVALIDTKGAILDVNRTFADRFGERVEDLVGTSIWDLFSPEATELRQAALARVVQSGESQRLEEERQGRWFDSVVYPILDPQGKATRIAIFARDITDRKRAEEALRESEERWRTLVESAPDTILTVDREGRILFVNRVRSGFGVTVDDMIGRSILDYAPPETRGLVAESIQKVFVEGANLYHEGPVAMPDGSLAWYGNRFGPIKRDGEVVAVMVITHDITEHKQIEQVKDNLIRDVSHELRTPLAKMHMSLELLLELLNKEPINRQKATGIGEMAFGNVQRLLQTVEAILDLSALEAGRVVYERIKMLPGDLIDEALQYMRPMAEAKGLELVASVPKDLPAVEGDLEKLSRVMINLIDNAIKFSKQGQIVLSAQRNEQEVEFAVGDSGFGIQKENLGRLFERFYQERTSVLGSGIGLPICKAIVEAHGGRIWAESPGRGQGATLRFTLSVKVDAKE